MTLYDILLYCNNFFDITREFGNYEIDNNKILFEPTEDYYVGQYVRIKNSIFNDGVYQILTVESDGLTIDATLTNEDTRRIVVYGLAIPNDFLSLTTNIIANGKTTNVKSESISRYSVSYGGNGSAWQNVYKDQLAPYKKLGWS